MLDRPDNLEQLRAAWQVLNGAATDVPCFRMQDGERVRLHVQGMIGGWRNDASKFVETVHALDAGQPVDLYVNSRGGFVWDAVAMYDALREHRGEVSTHIGALAASAASFVALAGDKVEITKPGRVMIHMAQTIAIGSPDEVRAAADLGDAVSADIAGIYADRAGGSATSWLTAMRATTWYSSSQAVEAGLAHTIAAGSDSTPKTGASNRSRLVKARAAAALGGVK